jgi:predicted dehydrogenase
MTLRFAIFGAGFWSHYQLPGWLETGMTECVAVCDPDRQKAQALAEKFSIPIAYERPEDVLAHEKLDFIDICSPVETHAPLARLALSHGLNVVCQKPLAPTLGEAEALAQAFEAAGKALLVNENWRWQQPLRRLKARMDAGTIGRIFRAHIDYRSSFPVFDNQPFLKTLRQFIITDMGTHILDVARFLFGEITELYCHTHKVHSDIAGEDAAVLLMKSVGGASIICEISYASPREHDRFPETYVDMDGEHGALALGPDLYIRETTSAGTLIRREVPLLKPWMNPAYGLIHEAIVSCQTHLARALAGLEPAETTAADNLNTLRLVYKAYESAETGQVIRI